MAKTVRDRLLEALDDLGEEDLKRFKESLHEFPMLREGFEHIAWGRLQKADAVDVSRLLVQFYTEGYAPQVTAEVLEGIHCKRQAEKLLQAVGQVGCIQTSSPSTNVTSGGNVLPELHFIDRHREALIQRTATVEAILDLLHTDILDEDQYQTISAKRTSQEKMRELYKLVPSWNRDCKDKLLEAIKKKNKFLIDDIEGQA